jgi:hypothetical protein
MEALDTRVRCLLLSEATALAAEARRKRPRFTTLRDRVAARDTGGTAEGLRRLRAFWDNMAQIEASYLTLSKQQREIVTEFVRCACVKIIGEENFERHPPFFMRKDHRHQHVRRRAPPDRTQHRRLHLLNRPPRKLNAPRQDSPDRQRRPR